MFDHCIGMRGFLGWTNLWLPIRGHLRFVTKISKRLGPLGGPLIQALTGALFPV